MNGALMTDGAHQMFKDDLDPGNGGFIKTPSCKASPQSGRTLFQLTGNSCVQKDKFLVYAQENGTAVAFIVLLGSTVALAYNAVHNMLLKRTSSVAVCHLSPLPKDEWCF